MAPFAGDLVASYMELPIYDDASAYACPEYDAENDTGVRGSAIHGLRKARQFASFSIRIGAQAGLKVAVEGFHLGRYCSSSSAAPWMARSLRAWQCPPYRFGLSPFP